ncbi:hypothetical protein SVAN01_05441 [Stagonosporopsis vannaccii]|nr:hypothetical protein SVAN01_05441 [Stagonosporopsis vannaccii]
MTEPDVLSSAGVPLLTFHHFPQLPGNLRAQILSHAMPAPRTRFIELYACSAPTYTPRIRYVPPLPPLFSATRETRTASITHEGGSLMHLFFSANPSKNFYINFTLDIVFLSSRFAPRGSTETARLRELSSLLMPVFLMQLKRIVVTYSGHDDFKRIGCVLMDFARLETLYVAMWDRWGEERVRERVGKGRPVKGFVSWRVEESVRDVHGEQTEDEDEDLEEHERRVEDAERVRVVECILSLDE